MKVTPDRLWINRKPIASPWLAPAAPTLVQTEREVGEDEWGTWDFLNIQLSPAEESVYYRIESSTDESFSSPNTVYRADWISIGYGHCSITHSSEDLDQVTHLRITAIDLAGNESEPAIFEVDTSIEEETENPAPEDSSKVGCASLGSGSGMSLALVWMVGLLSLRRRS